MRNKWIWTGIGAAVLVIAAVVAMILHSEAGKGEMRMSDKGNTEAIGTAGQSINTEPKNTVSINVKLSELGQTMENKFSDINQWDMAMDWTTEKASGQPENYMREKYPFVKRVQLMTATGGHQTRDLLLDPSDRKKMDDYSFTRLGTAIDNIIRQGLTPYIVIGNVPLKYSSEPYIGGFGVNVRPPDDYKVYFKYVKALGEYLVERFGLEEVRNWTWRALVEYENVDWFNAGDPVTTKEAYFKLYDYTVAALEEVVGAEHLYIGAHSMTNAEGFWDEREFIDHVASGTNYYTGKKGTQLDFLTFSYYDTKPGVRAPAPYTVASDLSLLRDRAVKNGLTDLKYGVDEGRIACGQDDKELYPRTVASSYQSAYDAKLYKEMHDINLDYFSTWYLNTECIWGEAIGIDPVGTHLANLSYRMEGGARASVQASKPVSADSDEVDGIAAYHQDSQKAQLLLYNFNEDPALASGEAVAVTFDKVEALRDGSVKVKKWIIDDDHANYWPKWEEDMKKRGISADDFGKWSADSWTISGVARQKVQDYWYANIMKYRDLSMLKMEEVTVEIKDGKLVLTEELAPQGVVFYEITGLKPSL